tara:strand:- start:40 stop:558 length:519 start_codon:yes stop_codon:yes gene_type:complete
MSKSQATGRIGELSVEIELVNRNWLVGNFNSNIQNAAVYDLFAVKKNNKKLIRVKAYSLFKNDHGTIQYAVKKSGKIFLDLEKDNKDDFVILCGVMNGNVKEYFIIPTFVVDTTLKESNRIYHLGKKKDGSKRKVTNHRALFLQESKDHYWCGWRRKWKKYLNNWSILEKNV